LLFRKDNAFLLLTLRRDKQEDSSGRRLDFFCHHATAHKPDFSCTPRAIQRGRRRSLGRIKLK